jgi:hypothetical protein
LSLEIKGKKFPTLSIPIPISSSDNQNVLSIPLLQLFDNVGLRAPKDFQANKPSNILTLVYLVKVIPGTHGTH